MIFLFDNWYVMYYPKFPRTLLSFLVVLIVHVLAIWFLLSSEKSQSKIHTPKVILASLVAPTKAQAKTPKASSKSVSKKPVSSTKLKADASTPVLKKPKTEIKPEPSSKAIKPTPLPVAKTETETQKMSEPNPIETVIPEQSQDHTEQNEISDNSTEITNETEQTKDQIVTEIKVDAQSTQNFPPVYPKLSKRLKEQGTVILSMLISAQGRIEAISIQESSGFSRLDQAALTAAAKWRYEPATINGKAIANSYLMPIEFKLNTSKR